MVLTTVRYRRSFIGVADLNLLIASRVASCLTRYAAPLEVAMSQTLFHGHRLSVKPLRRTRSLPPKPLASATRPEPPSSAGQEQQQQTLQSSFRAVAIAAAVYTTCSSPPAQAWDHSWKPRRHHRRLGDSKTATFNVQEFFRVG